MRAYGLLAEGYFVWGTNEPSARLKRRGGGGDGRGWDLCVCGGGG